MPGTQKIFSKKKYHLFDIFVEMKRKNFTFSDPIASQQIRITEGDETRFAYLKEKTLNSSATVEEEIINFFFNLNNKIFRGLKLASTRSEVVPIDKLPSWFGLHDSDIHFLNALIEKYQLNICISREKRFWCC